MSGQTWDVVHAGELDRKVKSLLGKGARVTLIILMGNGYEYGILADPPEEDE